MQVCILCSIFITWEKILSAFNEGDDDDDDDDNDENNNGLNKFSSFDNEVCVCGGTNVRRTNTSGVCIFIYTCMKETLPKNISKKKTKVRAN